MTGVGTYIYNLFFNLVKYHPEFSYKLFTSSLKDRWNLPFVGDSDIKIYDKHIPVKLVDLLFTKLPLLKMEFITGKIDLFHSPNPILPPLGRCARIVTVHDIYFLKNPARTQKASRDAFSSRMKHDLERADRIICVSRFTADEIIDYFGTDNNKIQVIHHGIDHDESSLSHASGKEDSTNIRQKYNIAENEKMILYIGTIEPRKNPTLLLEAFEILCNTSKDKLRLIIGGGYGWGIEEIKRKIDESKHRQRITVTGYLPRSDIESFYKESDVLILPSYYEGFGLPIIEAMAFGLPVITANRSSMPEVGGNAALYFENDDPIELAELMKKVLEDNQLREEYIKRGIKHSSNFHWRRTADETASLYREVLGV
ncbi:MAG: glycosyltransferase family 4 protein [Acidobacteria bacterium]|nr:glycosyltransferase family 4 protein [Acidobacteriota bacterium]